jgi:hypothetical protein
MTLADLIRRLMAWQREPYETCSECWRSACGSTSTGHMEGGVFIEQRAYWCPKHSPFEAYREADKR